MLARLALLAAGLLGPALRVYSFARRYELGLDAPWYLLSLVGVGYVPWFAVVVLLAWIAVAAQLSAVAAGRYAPYPDTRVRTPRGPIRQVLATAARTLRPPTGSVQVEDRDAREG